MAISRTFVVKIKDDSARPIEDMFIYRNDTGVDVYVEIVNLRYSIGNEGVNDDFNVDHASAIFKSPSNYVYKADNLKIIDKRIKFSFTKEVVAMIQEIGLYELQFRLYDASGNRLTIPSYFFNVKNPIDEPYEDGSSSVVDSGRVGFSTVSDEKSIILFEVENGYIKTDWKSGDLITANRLNNIEDALLLHDNKLAQLLYVPLAINFSANKSTLEKGSIVNSVLFNWSYNKNIISQKFNNEVLSNEVRKLDYSTPFSSNKTFKLDADDNKSSFTKSLTINFLNGRYWGVSSDSFYNSDFVKKLNKELVENKGKTFTVDCGYGQHIFYCIPSRLGNPIFTVGGFSGGFNKVNVIQFENSSGFIESYDIWKSTNSNLGSTQVIVT